MLDVRGVTVRFGAKIVLDGVDLAVDRGETVVVLGPSGCGKSTLLRAIAGLEPIAAGEVRWDGDRVDQLPPHRRQFGLMFQDYALFPHRDVRGNVEFGLRMAGMAAVTRAARVHEVLELVGLERLATRKVATLSGGEQQRVALARALAPSPRLLMLDEPLGALDRVLRERLVDELHTLLRAASLPAIYVTHDHDEAFALADRVVVMRAGRVVQVATPAELWRVPADDWVARFLGFGPAVEIAVVDGVARTPWGPVPARGTEVCVVLRPDAVVRAEHGVDAVVVRRTFAGNHVALDVRVGDATPVAVRVGIDDHTDIGDRICVAIDQARVLVYGRSA
jgi:thiamine transport system ATP-binding protein